MKINVKTLFTVIKSIGIIIAFIIMAGACKKTDFPGANPQSIISDSIKTILFIGNSLTYTNELPKLVEAIGKERGIEIKTTMIAFPNYALEDHWNDGRIQTLIADKKYDFVVVQQGPSSQSDGSISLIEYGAKIKEICSASNSQLAFFMVWPAFANFHTYSGVINSYTNAAIATNSILCPVGQVWRDYFLATGDYAYFGPDMFHPSLKGSENAALIIFQILFQG
ncbi:MAG: SGNH/GDSL hydrolase family protein [Saprospiraceae bacterium]|jgi:hypothetical protein|nr:SGNH/GDSL hydrolase family protein [Saprospiraceae bacterium]MBL0024093.1 SGNH/GDSL hydrolase family protein [Saprospiraceae bacterium]